MHTMHSNSSMCHAAVTCTKEVAMVIENGASIIMPCEQAQIPLEQSTREANGLALGLLH